VPAYLKSGNYQPRPSTATISNAMDVGAPSNFARMQALFGNSWEAMRGRIEGMSFTDDQTRAAVREVKSLYNYEIDPHGAVGWLAARKWRAANPGNATITLETAHPSKFLDVMEQEIGKNVVEIPSALPSSPIVRKWPSSFPPMRPPSRPGSDRRADRSGRARTKREVHFRGTKSRARVKLAACESRFACSSLRSCPFRHKPAGKTGSLP
jgi:threonine synthase